VKKLSAERLDRSTVDTAGSVAATIFPNVSSFLTTAEVFDTFTAVCGEPHRAKVVESGGRRAGQ
jgi:hypothetical protein